ncbi:hypothetical protein F7725_025829 [Dissostichus mawsoni]|uniref:Uncharacterized protein n=1 Tax=Dissostichus mawsoni TaxID=36200 RepID=A0A7J5X5C2_DISMA|nr:hypothetical protein F7725_025829 [Dissostichus mawsoni]
MPSEHPGDYVLLQRANTQITDLKKDIRRLSDELKEKDSLVSSLMEVASVQSKQLVSFSATIHDTVLWDPSTCPRPSDSSTPGHQQSWSEVVRRSLLNGETSPPRLRLQNRFTTLSDDPVHPADAPAALTRPDDPVHPADAPAALTSPDLHPADTATPAPAADSICAASQATVKSTRRPSSRLATSSRRKLLKEAVLRHSGSFPGPEPARKSSPSPAVTVSPQHSPARSPHPQSPAPPRPLFAPTTLIIGDSITRNIRFFNAATRCLPGATVPVILEKLPGLLHSLPSSVNRLIVHVGSNDTARQQSAAVSTARNFSSSLMPLTPAISLSGATQRPEASMPVQRPISVVVSIHRRLVTQVGKRKPKRICLSFRI